MHYIEELKTVIQQNKQLRMENILSLRKKATQIQMQQEMTRIGEILTKEGIKKNESVVTATFSVEMQGGQELMDIEILV